MTGAWLPANSLLILARVKLFGLLRNVSVTRKGVAIFPGKGRNLLMEA